jgi:hypothetical protein
MIGRDKNRTFWKVLKIDRLDQSELNISEDQTKYSEIECCEMLKRLQDGNLATGGLKFVTTCYGIIGISYPLYHSKTLITIQVFISTLFIIIRLKNNNNNNSTVLWYLFLFRVYQIS